jgi:hypothetical protein
VQRIRHEIGPLAEAAAVSTVLGGHQICSVGRLCVWNGHAQRIILIKVSAQDSQLTTLLPTRRYLPRPAIEA